VTEGFFDRWGGGIYLLHRHKVWGRGKEGAGSGPNNFEGSKLMLGGRANQKGGIETKESRGKGRNLLIKRTEDLYRCEPGKKEGHEGYLEDRICGWKGLMACQGGSSHHPCRIGGTITTRIGHAITCKRRQRHWKDSSSSL